MGWMGGGSAAVRLAIKSAVATAIQPALVGGSRVGELRFKGFTPGYFTLKTQTWSEMRKVVAEDGTVLFFYPDDAEDYANKIALKMDPPSFFSKLLKMAMKSYLAYAFGGVVGDLITKHTSMMARILTKYSTLSVGGRIATQFGYALPAAMVKATVRGDWKGFVTDAFDSYFFAGAFLAGMFTNTQIITDTQRKAIDVLSTPTPGGQEALGRTFGTTVPGSTYGEMLAVGETTVSLYATPSSVAYRASVNAAYAAEKAAAAARIASGNASWLDHVRMWLAQ